MFPLRSPSPPSPTDAARATPWRTDAAEVQPPAQRRRLSADVVPEGLALRASPATGLAPRAALPGTCTSQAATTFRPEVAAEHHPELMDYLEDLEQALDEGRTPDTADAQFLPELLAGVNAAHPGLQLERHLFELGGPKDELLASSLAQRLQDSLGSGQAWQGVLTDGDHGTAISLRFSAHTNDVSLLVVDSVGWGPFDALRKRQAWQATLNTLTDALQARVPDGGKPVRLHLGMTDTGVQKSAEGCHIFAIAAAQKMATDPAIQSQHERALFGLLTGRMAAGVNHLDAPRNLPPSLFKHATSKDELKHYIQVSSSRRRAAQAKRNAGFTGWQRLRPDAMAPVNKKGQNLLERHAAHEVTRPDRAQPGRSRTYSNSYEHKRIHLVRQALTHLTAGLD